MIHYGYSLRTNSGMQGEYPEITEKRTSYGAILLLGIEYRIKPWLSIGSETSLQFVKFKYSKSFEFEMMGLSEASVGSKNFDITYRATNGFFLMIHF